MSTTNPAVSKPKSIRRQNANRPSITFAEWFVVLNGCLPLVIMMWDARQHQLGPEPIRRAIAITGTMAIVLLLATLCITPVRRWTRWNWLHGYRRPLGMVSFLYGVAHLLIYVGLDQQWHWQKVGSELMQRRFLQFGVVALLAMLPLALTSSPRMIRWLTIRRWRMLHRLIYPSIIAATIHLVMQSKVSIGFQALVVIATVTLLLARVRLPLRAQRSHKLSHPNQ